MPVFPHSVVSGQSIGGVTAVPTGGVGGGGGEYPYTLAALMQRQKDAMSMQQENLQQGQPTIAGGLGQMANALFSALAQRRYQKLEQQGRQALGQAWGSFDPNTGQFGPGAMATIGALEPDE